SSLFSLLSSLFSLLSSLFSLLSSLFSLLPTLISLLDISPNPRDHIPSRPWPAFSPVQVIGELLPTMETLTTFQIVLVCPDMDLGWIFTATPKKNGLPPDMNISLQFEVYFVTATLNGFAKFNFHPEALTDAPIVSCKIRVIVHSVHDDAEPESSISFSLSSPDLDGICLGITHSAFIHRHAELRPGLSITARAPGYFVDPIALGSYLKTPLPGPPVSG
ncbi:unnamed protein product, partial [Penicillium salamii]